jgi:hypothetical protein
MAIVGPNLGLAIWNDSSDNWNTDQLRNNWAKLEFHDHGPGRGMQIPTEGLQDGAVTAAKMAPGANAIQNGSVTPAKFAALPATKVYKGSITALPNGVETTLTFDTERFDSANLHDNTTNPDRLTCQQAGLYLITLSFNSNVSPTTGVLRAGIYKNGIVNALARSAMTANAVTHTLTTYARLAFGDYIVARILNTTGAAVNVLAGTAVAEDLNDFGMVWIAP